MVPVASTVGKLNTLIEKDTNSIVRRTLQVSRFIPLAFTGGAIMALAEVVRENPVEGRPQDLIRKAATTTFVTRCSGTERLRVPKIVVVVGTYHASFQD